MAGRSLNISLVATLTPLEKSLAAVGKMMTDFAQSIAKTDQKLSDSIKASVATMDSELAKVKASFDNVGKGGDEAGKKAGGSLRQQLRQATIEAQKASEQFGRMSPQFIAAAEKAAHLKDEMGDVAQAIDAMNPDEKFKAFAGVLQGVAGGFMAVEGTMAAFGIKSEEAEKTMAKLQGLMAMSQGLNQLGALKDSMGALKMQLVGATAGMSAFKIALVATGIGAAVVVIGYLVTHWQKFKKALFDTIPGLGKVADYIGSLVQKVGDFFGVTSEGERKMAKVMENADKSLERNKKYLQQHSSQMDEYTKKKFAAVDAYNNAVKEEGQTEKDIYNLKLELARQIKAIDEERTAASIEAVRKRNDAMKKAQADLEAHNKSLKSEFNKSNEDYSHYLYETNRKREEADKLMTRGVKTNISGPNRMQNPIAAPGVIREYSSMARGTKDFAKQVTDMNKQLETSFEELAVVVGESLGKALTGKFDGGEFFSSVLTTISSFIQSMGRLLIAYGVSMDAFKKAFKNPYLAIAAGVALIAIGGAVKAKATSLGEQKKMAAGGIAYGPTNALVGEYSGASNNPEVVAPLDKLQGILSKSMGGGNVTVRGMIKGNDLQLLQVKTGRDNNRITGR